VTLRRLQKFRVKEGDRLSVTIGETQPTTIVAGERGLLTIPHVVISSPQGVRVTIRRVNE
jgi:hypothetical protein